VRVSGLTPPCILLISVEPCLEARADRSFLFESNTKSKVSSLFNASFQGLFRGVAQHALVPASRWVLHPNTPGHGVTADCCQEL
jgi:hypothetical protein